MDLPVLKRILWLKASSFYSYVCFPSWLIEPGKAVQCRGFETTYVNSLFQDEINWPLSESFLFLKRSWVIFLDHFGDQSSYSTGKGIEMTELFGYWWKQAIFVKMPKTSIKAPQADSQDLLLLSPSYLVWASRSMSMDTASPDGVWVTMGPAVVGGPPLSALVLAAAHSWLPGALFRCLRWPTLTINWKNIFAFNGMHHIFTFMHEFRVILDMHPLTKFKWCLRMQDNLQLSKPRNKWLELFNIFIHFPPLIISSINISIKNLAIVIQWFVLLNPHKISSYRTPYYYSK